MFKLNIESTKDINELHITFADGTSIVSTSNNHHSVRQPNAEIHKKPKDQTDKRKEKFLDLDSDFGGISQEVVNLPEINRSERPVNVASELQNLDI